MGHYNELPELEIETILKVIEDNGSKCSCGKTFKSHGKFESYKHDGGLRLKGFLTPQWAYIHCLHCRYNTAIWKILNEDDWKIILQGTLKTFKVGDEELPAL